MDLVAQEEIKENDLYGKAVVLMDGETGRVLYGKNADQALPMASTTKIMTLIVALENASEDEVVTVSKYASTMPDVQLNIREGEEYYLKDLLHSLMLESHNDSAVAIAEHVAGDVESFAELMNQKAVDLGCTTAHFITPNGLDGKDEISEHSISATDLAKIMKYCIQNERFLEITQTTNYSFSDISGKRSYQISNKNAFLSMMEGAISGKTGFTNNAGFCYVGALRRDSKTLIVVTLGCGWPPNKRWKWQDTTKLMNYGLSQYAPQVIGEVDNPLADITVINGQQEWLTLSTNLEQQTYLVRNDERIEIDYSIPKTIEAPIHKGDQIGEIIYYIDGEEVASFEVIADEEVKKINYLYCLEGVVKNWLKVFE